MSKRGKRALYATIVAIFLFLFGIFGSDIFAPEIALSYDTHIAHPSIVEMAARLYNEKYNPDLTEEQIGWMKQGAVDADTPTRWLNHFYDPVNNRGLLFGGIRHQASKYWAQDPFNQANFSLGDHSWQRAFNQYYYEDFENAFTSLGYVLHLIADSSVPAHTRDDPHPTGDSYEQFVKKNWDKLAPDIKKLSKFQKVDSLDSAIDAVAKFSNGNFYSDSTIDISRYKKPSVPDLSDKYQTIGKGYYKFKVNADEYDILICRDPRINIWQDTLKDEFSDFVCIVDDDTVLTSYANHLLPAAVGHTAGVIKLFLDKAEAQEMFDNKLPLLSMNLNGLFDYAKSGLISKAENIWNKIKGNTAESVAAEAIGTISQSVIPAQAGIQPVAPSPSASPPSATPADRRAGGDTPNQPPPTVNKPKPTPTSTPLPTQPPAPTPAPKPLPPPPRPLLGQEGGDSASPATPPTKTTSPCIGCSGNGGGGGSPPPSSPSLPSVSTSSSVILSESEESLNNNSTSTPDTSTTSSTSTTTPETPTSSPSSQEGETDATTSTPDTTTSTPDTSTTTVILNDSEESLNDNSTSTPDTSTSTIDTSTTTPDTATSSPSSEEGETEGVTTTPPAPIADIIINEIAWAGTDSTRPNNEWLELYNTTDAAVTLTWSGASKWILRAGATNFSINKTNNTVIPAHGYYLLERTSDNTIKVVTADAIFSLSGGLNNSGAKIELVAPSGEIIDSVDASGGWFAGDNTGQYRSMERLSEFVSSSDPNNWQSNQGPRYTPRTYGGSMLYGSPQASNFGGIVLYGNQVEDNLILTASNSPYTLVGHTVPVGKILTIGPGAVIKSYNKSSKITVYGKLVVDATENPAVITSGRDQNFEEEKDKEIIGTYADDLPADKDWHGMMFYPGSDISITGLDMRYAGSEFKEPGSGMWTPKVSKAIWAQDIDLVINSSTFAQNGDTTIYGDGINLEVSNSDFSSGVLAIETESGSLVVSGGKIQEFSDSNGPISTRYIWPVIANVEFENNTADATYLNAPRITTSTTWSTGAQFNLNSLTIDDGAVLTIEAGVEVRLAKYADVVVNGELIVNGTADNPVKFLPITAGQNWGNLKFMSASGTVNNAILTEGNLSTTEDQAGNGAIIVDNSNVVLNGIQILDSRPPGNNIQINSGELRITDSILGHNVKPSFETTGIKMLGGELWLDNVLFQNLGFGLRGTGDPRPPYHTANMSDGNYVNVGMPANPAEWLPT